MRERGARGCLTVAAADASATGAADAVVPQGGRDGLERRVSAPAERVWWRHVAAPGRQEVAHHVGDGGLGLGRINPRLVMQRVLNNSLHNITLHSPAQIFNRAQSGASCRTTRRARKSRAPVL